MAAESIYTWIKPPPEVPVKPPLYHAKARPDAPLAGSTLKVGTHSKGWGTLGAELKGTIRPDRFLRAHEKTGHIDSSSIPKPYHRPPEEAATKKPAVPRRDERPTHAPPSGKDFVTDNAIAAIITQPKVQPKEAVDWMHRPGFGTTPRYLSRVRAELEAEREYVLAMMEDAHARSAAEGGAAVRELTSGEREELMAALKAKWDEVSAKYGVIAHRKISTSNSTQGEIRWKESCEALMAQLEADIKKLSVNAPIYVADE